MRPRVEGVKQATIVEEGETTVEEMAKQSKAIEDARHSETGSTLTPTEIADLSGHQEPPHDDSGVPPQDAKTRQAGSDKDMKK